MTRFSLRRLRFGCGALVVALVLTSTPAQAELKLFPSLRVAGGMAVSTQEEPAISAALDVHAGVMLGFHGDAGLLLPELGYSHASHSTENLATLGALVAIGPSGDWNSILLGGGLYGLLGSRDGQLAGGGRVTAHVGALDDEVFFEASWQLLDVNHTLVNAWRGELGVNLTVAFTKWVIAPNFKSW